MRAVTVLLLCVFAIGIGQAQVQKPALGSPLRKAILDGLRPSIEKDLGQKVIFKVEEIRVYQGWAFVHARSLQPSGKPIDFKKTRYRQAQADGMFDGDSTYGLLRLTNKAWKVKTYAIGPTDVVWIGWMEAPYRAPKALFPSMGG